jgi:tripartite-type tricarboxylate transporter receptor subunit TctC
MRRAAQQAQAGDIRAALRLLAAVFTAVLLCASAGYAQDAETFYRTNNKITLGASGGVGGGYDAYARLLSRHLPKHMPGTPTVIVQNITAAGGLQVANLTYNTAPKDGTFLGEVRGSVVQDHLLGNPAAKFDGRKFNWIGNLNVDRDACVMATASGVSSIKDFYAREVVVGATGVGAQSYSFPTAYNKILGMKFKVINGYAGTPARVLAMERGELMGACGITTSTVRSTLDAVHKAGKVKVVSQSASGAIDPGFPDVPNVLDEAKTPEQRQQLQLLFVALELGRPYTVPPEVPADRVALLRRAFVETMQDAALVEEAKRLQLDIDYLDGAKTAATAQALYATPQAVIDSLKAALAN